MIRLIFSRRGSRKFCTASSSTSSMKAATPEKPVAVRMSSSGGRKEPRFELRVTSGSLPEGVHGLDADLEAKIAEQRRQGGELVQHRPHDQRVHHELAQVVGSLLLLPRQHLTELGERVVGGVAHHPAHRAGDVDGLGLGPAAGLVRVLPGVELDPVLEVGEGRTVELRAEHERRSGRLLVAPLELEQGLVGPGAPRPGWRCRRGASRAASGGRTGSGGSRGGSRFGSGGAARSPRSCPGAPRPRESSSCVCEAPSSPINTPCTRLPWAGQRRRFPMLPRLVMGADHAIARHRRLSRRGGAAVALPAEPGRRRESSRFRFKNRPKRVMIPWLAARDQSRGRKAMTSSWAGHRGLLRQWGRAWPGGAARRAALPRGRSRRLRPGLPQALAPDRARAAVLFSIELAVEWEHFHPDQLAERVPALSKLLEARDAVGDPPRMRRLIAESGVDAAVAVGADARGGRRTPRARRGRRPRPSCSTRSSRGSPWRGDTVTSRAPRIPNSTA